MDKLFLWSAAFNIPTLEARKYLPLYHEAMANVPADLLQKAVNTAVKAWTWGNRLPMPAELLHFIRAEMDEINGAVFTLENVARKFARAEAEKTQAIADARGRELADTFAKTHGMTMAEAQAEWRRRQGLKGEPKDRSETLAAIRGSVTIFAPGFEPETPVEKEPQNRSLGQALSRVVNELKTTLETPVDNHPK